jgi:hypothetical protein
MKPCEIILGGSFTEVAGVNAVRLVPDLIVMWFTELLSILQAERVRNNFSISLQTDGNRYWR